MDKEYVLQLLEPIDDAQPYTSFEAIVEVAGSENCKADAIKATLRDLIEQGIVTERHDHHSGRREVALTVCAEQCDEIYAELKEKVRRAAAKRGHHLRWTRGRGWSLEDDKGALLEVGAMHRLAAYLGIRS